MDENKKDTINPEINSELSEELEEQDLAVNDGSTIQPEIERLIKIRESERSGEKKEIINIINRAAINKQDTLILSGMNLTELPHEIGSLTDLKILDISGNKLEDLPPEFTKLSNLEVLYLQNNRFNILPEKISSLVKLTTLYLNNNHLSQISKSIRFLVNLTSLNLSYNNLETLPQEIRHLSSLIVLDISHNKFTRIPYCIGSLQNIQELEYGDNKILSPPPEILAQGTSAIIAYLHESQKADSQQWISKLLIVGEGGVGKTSLLRALRGEVFDPQSETTHGLEIKKLILDHPKYTNTKMNLMTWDFGGQQIYHATHQFFLTNRSLFLIVWNARFGYEQGKLFKWLDTVKALAPESPIIIVATCMDQAGPKRPINKIRETYYNVVDYCMISNKTNSGIAELRQRIQDTASELPLMGETWPAEWLEAAEEIRNIRDKYITIEILYKILASHNVSGPNSRVLIQWLHELGDILYFSNDETLEDIVILKPQWVSEYIGRVLESKEVTDSMGIFRKSDMDHIWSDISPEMRNHFLRLMERFDLSYRTLEDRDISLVVELLPYDPPDYIKMWNSIKENINCREITIRYYLSTIPAGIPSWFIARSHRFTTYTHWRNGALLSDSVNRQHLALIIAHEHNNMVELSVRGPLPYNYFALLMDGLELTLKRFPGLEPKKMVPCPGHRGKICGHEFKFNNLQKAYEMLPPQYSIQCEETMEMVSLSELLFGILWKSTEDDVLKRIDDLEAALTGENTDIKRVIEELRRLTQRGFTSNYNREQSKIESHCPNIFVLKPQNTSKWRKRLMGQRVNLQLYCQAPGEWHPVIEGGCYEVPNPSQWVIDMAPYIKKLVSILKYAAPIIGPWADIAPEDYGERFEEDISLMNELAEIIPDPEEVDYEYRYWTNDKARFPKMGSQLRQLRNFLVEKDK